MESERGSYIQLATAENGAYTTGRQQGEINKTRLKDPSLVRGKIILTKRDCTLISIVSLIIIVSVIATLSIGLPKLEAKRKRYYDVTIPKSDSILFKYKESAIVSDGEPCGEIGKSILDGGGSAVDSAIAMVFCGGVVNPHSMGLGGGFIMTIYNRSNKTVHVIDAREEAPSAAKTDMFLGNRSLSISGGLSVAVPGELSGLKLAHDKYGVSNWSDLIEPSVKLCRNGFKVSKHLADRIQKVKTEIIAEPTMAQLLINNQTGEVFREGEIMKCLQLANTLETIANEGADALYNGSLTEQFLRDIKSFGGIIERKDLNNYRAKLRDPVSASLRNGKTIYSAPPPASGPVLNLIMNILDGYNLTEKNFMDLESKVLTYHRMIEAFKFAFAQRTHLGDVDFVNSTRMIEHSMSKKYAENIRGKISDSQTFSPEYYGPVMFTPEDHGTAHASVIAANGDAVSVTSTINTLFGSMRTSTSTGIILNNEMDDFSSPNITNYFGVPPSPANFIEAGKRPLSSMCPAFIINSNGDIELVLGGAGGTRIISATAMVASGVLWMGMDIKEAIDAPRLHHQLFPNYVQHENQFPQVILDRLETLGHASALDDQNSIVLAIAKTNEGIYANVDFRKGGSSAGV